MAVYLISYDLNKVHKDYTKIISAIKKLDSSYYHVLKSQWLISSTKTAAQLNTILDDAIDADDDLFIIEVTKNFGGYISNAEELTSWINKRI